VHRALSGIVRQLDIRRAQVLVEAIIAEVSVQTVRELGVQWQLLSSLDAVTDADGNVIDIDGGAFGGTNFGPRGSGINIFDLATNPASAAQGLNIGYLSGTTSILGQDFLQISAVIRALEQDADTNVLSTPSVVTLDNQEAQIFVGEEVPFVTGQYTNTGATEGAINPFQTIQRELVGLTLNVTPHINEGDSVVLDIREEVSSLARTQLAVDLTTTKRELTTSVMVPDGAILILAGLTTDDVVEGQEAVPGLSRIPLLGNLFKYRSSSNVKRNLMLFIRPRILRDDADQAQISSSKYNYLRSEQIRSREATRGLTPAEEMPLLPELFDYLQAPVPEPPDGG
jgi:general secretion pathway protein D